jgi:prepilin-type N-terminal cleavage/methylation domain-containing protein
MAILKTSANNKAFTLAELLVALMITSILLTTMVTLGFALGVVNNNSNDTAPKQAQLRCATLRISELIRHSNLIPAASSNEIAVWRSDYNDDNKINPCELIYITSGTGNNYIKFLEFAPYGFAQNWFTNHSFTIDEIKLGQAKLELQLKCKKVYTALIPRCSNVRFLLDKSPSQTRFVSTSFDLEENGVTRSYQINAALRVQ